MSTPTPVPPSPAPVAVPVALPKLDALTLFSGLSVGTRWDMVRLLADGRRASVSEVAAAVKCDRDLAAKHLRWMRAAGIVEGSDGSDRRKTVYWISALRRPAPGLLDFGFARVDLKKI
ncbi:MAG: winged helix-turn-helix transcriptional regulator [Verrucomicrobia bacterium]|nr:winged helix-turn-helix transcriptional regulator [Verrucomicrobiota bacterium]